MTILAFTASAFAHGVGDLLAEAMKRHVADRVKRGHFSDAKITKMLDRREDLMRPRKPRLLLRVGRQHSDRSRDWFEGHARPGPVLRAFRRWVEARDCESSKSEGTSRTDPGKGRRSRSHRDRQRGAPG